jgi:hypothetical protein
LASWIDDFAQTEIVSTRSPDGELLTGKFTSSRGNA